jgi:two-component system, sensor histidine kinase and response regulator
MYKLYIIDDETDLLFMLTAFLTQAGYACESFSSAPLAWEQIIKSPPDAILCDMQMPVMTGMELLKKVRENEQLKTLPFIFFTASNHTDKILEALALGADDYITKPLDFNGLLTRIKTRLSYRNTVEQRVRQISLEEHMETTSRQMRLAFHDMMGVIGNIYTVSSLLNSPHKSPVDSGDRARFLGMVQRQSELSINMLRRVISMVGEQTEQANVASEYISFQDVLDKSMAMVQPLIEQKQLHFILPEESVEVWGNAYQWQSVLYNLISNAAKFTPDHGEIRVELKAQGGLVYLEVIDTGPGMPPETVNQLFGARLEPSADSSGKTGNGIGMLLCGQIIQAFQGKIEVASELGQGSRFLITVKGRQLTHK